MISKVYKAKKYDWILVQKNFQMGNNNDKKEETTKKKSKRKYLEKSI